MKHLALVNTVNVITAYKKR